MRGPRSALSLGQDVPPSCGGDRVALVGDPRVQRPPEEGGRPAEAGAIPPAPWRPRGSRRASSPGSSSISCEVCRTRQVASFRFPPVRMIVKTGTDRASFWIVGGRRSELRPWSEVSGGCAILFYCVDDIICVNATEVAGDRRRGSTHPNYRQARAPASTNCRS